MRNFSFVLVFIVLAVSASASYGEDAELMVVFRRVNPSDAPDVRANDKWIVDEMKALGFAGANITDPIELTAQKVVVEDCRHFGYLDLRVAKIANEEVVIEARDKREKAIATVTIPYKAGEHKLVKQTISSSVAKMDLYLAFSVEPYSEKWAEEAGLKPKEID